MSGLEVHYVGPDLGALFDQTPAKRAASRMASRGGDALHDAIVEHTPIRTGNLRTAWYREPTVEEGRRHYSRVKNDIAYSAHVNYGTGLWGPEHRKYLIEPHPPRRFLSWIDPERGGRVYARYVWHPGSEGAHMVEKGARDVEARHDAILTPELEVFKREMEAQILQAQKGRL